MINELGETFRIELARAAGPTSDLTPTAVSHAAATALAADGAGVTLLGAEFNLPVGASTTDAGIAEQIQATLGDGPCVAAARWGAPMLVDEDELARLWPIYHDQLVARTSLRSVFVLPLDDEDGVFAVLSVYSTRASFPPLPAPEEVQDQVGRLAGQILLGRPTAMDDSASDDSAVTETDHARYRTRLKVWTAVGILMAAGDREAGDALSLLRGYAYSHDLTLDEVGQRLIGHAIQPEDIL